MLAYWEPTSDLSDAERRHWLEAAERIARGLRLLAHLDSFTDVCTLRVGFTLNGDEQLAGRYVTAIAFENVEARRAAAGPHPANERSGNAGRRALRRIVGRLASALPADEVLLPCAPQASAEEIKHVVLAAVKASHGLEFGIEVNDITMG